MERPSREELKKILIECLRREEGEATPDRLLCAYQKLKGLSKEELLKLAEECDEIEVIRERPVYLSWLYYRGLRLRGVWYN